VRNRGPVRRNERLFGRMMSDLSPQALSITTGDQVEGAPQTHIRHHRPGFNARQARRVPNWYVARRSQK